MKLYLLIVSVKICCGAVNSGFATAQRELREEFAQGVDAGKLGDGSMVMAL